MIACDTQIEIGSYKIQFETDDWECYKRVQSVIRDCIECKVQEEEDAITCFADLFKPKKER